MAGLAWPVSRDRRPLGTGSIAQPVSASDKTTVSPQSTVHRPPMRHDALLFGESAGRIVVSCARHHVERLQHLATRRKVPCALIGKVGGTHLTLHPWIDVLVEDLNTAWRTGLTKALKAQG